MRTRTTIPVPKVLAWSSDRTNTTGVEYIVIERVPGVQSFRKWDEMGEKNRIAHIKRLAEWERELASIKFPAYGSLYYKSSVCESEIVPLDSSIDPEGEFCIGPACDLSWLSPPDHEKLPEHYLGPCKCCLQTNDKAYNQA